MTKLRKLNARAWLISKLRSYSPLAFALSLFVVGVLLSGSISSLIYIQYKKDAQLEFESESKYAVEKIQSILSTYEIVLRDMRSLMYSVGLDSITRKNFKDYFLYRNVTEEFPGANGLGFVRKVKQNDLERYIKLTQENGYSAFKIKNFFPYKGDHWIIEYLEPLSTNKLAIGLNLASEPSRLETIVEAVRSGRAMLTPPITLVQNKQKINNGLLFILPIYQSTEMSKNNQNKQNEAFGLAYSPLLLDNLMREFYKLQNTVNVDIFARNINDEIVVLYKSKKRKSDIYQEKSFNHAVDIYGQKWNFYFTPSQEFSNKTARSIVPILTLMIFSSILLSLIGYFYALNNARKIKMMADSAKLGAIISNANDAVISFDLYGCITSWNEAAEKIFDYKQAQVLGSKFPSLFVPDHVKNVHDSILEKVIAGESISHFISPLTRKSGQIFQAEMTFFPINQGQLNSTGYAMFVRDVTLQVESEEQVRLLNENLENLVSMRTSELDIARRDLQMIFDSMPSMIGYWDSNLINRVANKAYNDWFGLDHSILKGKSMREVLGDELFEDNKAYIDGALAGEPQTFERSVKSQQGDIVRHSLAHYIPDIINGKVKGFYAIVNDITEVNNNRLQLESLLRHNQVLLSTISQQMLYSVTDNRGRIIEVNDNFCRVSGYSREELIGQTHQMINSAEHPKEFWVDMWRTISSGNAWHKEVCNRSKNGQIYWVDSVIAPFTGSAGNIERYVSLRTDITLRKSAESELAHVADLLSNVLQAASEMSIVATDQHGHISLFNAGAENLLGYSSNSVVGKMPNELLHCASEIKQHSEEICDRFGVSLDGFQVLVFGAEQRGVEVQEWTYLTHSGKALRVSLAVTVMREANGDVSGYLFIAQDITERLRKDMALQEAKRFAEQANEAKSQFLANMSHEVRTPINGIMGLCYMLERQPLPAASHQLISKIQLASQSLLEIVNDVLDFSKIEANKIDIEQMPFKLTELIDNVSGIARAAIRDKNVVLEVSSLPESANKLIGDPLRIGQVLTNLLSNAIKFTASGFIKLTVTKLSQDVEESTVRLRFTVSDSGIGIPETKLIQIFDAFNQADSSTSRSYGGTGLGLTISRKLTELMGGVISVESTLGQGSEFTIELPFALAANVPSKSMGVSRSQANGVIPEKRLEGLKLLVVDDSDLNREVAEYILRAEGAQVETAFDGLDAVERVLSANPAFDLVLMDIQMPRMDGYEATRAIRHESKFADLPIVALTAGAMGFQRDAALAAGLIGFVTKPFDVDQLIDEVCQHTQRKESVGNEHEEIMDAELLSALQGFKTRFLSNRLPKHVQQMREYLSNPAPEMLSTLTPVLHSLAGEAGMVGLSELGEYARRIETAITSQAIEPNVLVEQVELLATEIEQVLMRGA